MLRAHTFAAALLLLLTTATSCIHARKLAASADTSDARQSSSKKAPGRPCGVDYLPCLHGACCSPAGTCGFTAAHCRAGCQPEYGRCLDDLEPLPVGTGAPSAAPPSYDWAGSGSDSDGSSGSDGSDGSPGFDSSNGSKSGSDDNRFGDGHEGDFLGAPPPALFIEFTAPGFEPDPEPQDPTLTAPAPAPTASPDTPVEPPAVDKPAEPEQPAPEQPEPEQPEQPAPEQPAEPEQPASEDPEPEEPQPAPYRSRPIPRRSLLFTNAERRGACMWDADCNSGANMPGICQASGLCDNGDCVYFILAAGIPCNGGVCSRDGQCVPSLDYAPQANENMPPPTGGSTPASPGSSFDGGSSSSPSNSGGGSGSSPGSSAPSNPGAGSGSPSSGSSGSLRINPAPKGNDNIIWGQYAGEGMPVGPPGPARATYHYYGPDYYTSPLYCADAFAGLLAEGRGRELLEYPWSAYCNDQGLGSMTQDKCGMKLRVTNPATGQWVIVHVVDMCGQGGVDLDPVAFNAIDGNGDGYRNGEMWVHLEWVDPVVTSSRLATYYRNATDVAGTTSTVNYDATVAFNATMAAYWRNSTEMVHL